MHKRYLLAALLAVCTTSQAEVDVGVAVTVSQPGLYGRIEIGDFPRPEIVFPQPVVIAPVVGVVAPAPIYMHVPPGHAKNWRKYCSKYRACGQPVYFVKDSWYNDVYVPAKHGKGKGKGGKHGYDHDHDDGHGHHGKGKDKDKGKGHGKNH